MKDTNSSPSRARAAGVMLAVAALVWAVPAYAYLDPASASMVLQGLLAGAAGVLVVLRLYWHRFKSFLGRLLGRTASQHPDVGLIDPEPSNKEHQ